MQERLFCPGCQIYSQRAMHSIWTRAVLGNVGPCRMSLSNWEGKPAAMTRLSWHSLFEVHHGSPVCAQQPTQALDLRLKLLPVQRPALALALCATENASEQ